MAYALWSQDIFTKGELSPFMYARCTVNEYNNGLKTAQNVLTYPTGAAGKRFGTLYQLNVSDNIINPKGFYFQTFQYANECVYQILINSGATNDILIFLEGTHVADVAGIGAGYNPATVFNLNTTVIGTAFRVCGIGVVPKDLTRASDAGNVIASVSGGVWHLTTPVTMPVTGSILPIRVGTSGTLPTTTPQVVAGVTYFIKLLTTTTVSVYATSYNAKNNIDPFVLTNNGSGTNTMYTLNTWSFTTTTFKNLPAYDFNGATTSYDAITFTPSATTGAAVTITLSGAYAPLTSAYIGGAFIGGGGTSRITGVTDTTHFTVAVQTPFDSTSAIRGSLTFLAEPAWSNARGWPQVCSSYQSRALFANTASLPNGFWASVINDYPDFGDLTADDDDAIGWYPTSDNMNYIRFIVPYRSITVHTNTGIYSSPLSDLVAITPSNFTLQLQDSTPADVLLPQAIDNQVLVLSGNDAHQMLWDGINNAYTSNVVSIINEQTIRDPVDEVAFINLTRAGSRFVFIINDNGTIAVFQTLISQNVSGFTPGIMEQSYGTAKFLQAATSADGRCWFIVQREIATASAPIAITAFATDTLTAVASSFSTTSPTAIKFTTSGTLPAASTTLTTDNYFWAVGVDANTFMVYLTQQDALDGVSNLTFTSAGTSSNVVAWPLVTNYTLEELTFDVFLDCAVKYSGSATDTITTGSLFNAQTIKMVGDGYGFESAAEDNVDNEIVFDAHGDTVEVTEAYIGFPINTIIEPMPLNISSGPSAKESILTKPINIRFARFMFNNTIGGTINGAPIALSQFEGVSIGEPPVPQRGIFEMSIFNAWDDFNNPIFTIEHNEPFDIQLLGVFYSIETS